MFSSVGWPEIAVLLIVALVIFGPDRLPGAVKQAGSALRQARETLTGARKQMQDEFGDVMPDFDPAMLNPRAFVRKHLLEDTDLDGSPLKPADNAMERNTPKPEAVSTAAPEPTPAPAVTAADPEPTPAVAAEPSPAPVVGGPVTDPAAAPTRANSKVNGVRTTAAPGAGAAPSVRPISSGRTPVVITDPSTPIGGLPTPVPVPAGPPVAPVPPYDDETT